MEHIYKVQLHLKKPTENGYFFRFSVEDKAEFWFTQAENGNIYSVTAQFTDKRYEWIHLYVEVDNDSDGKKYYPTQAYMETYSLKMTSEQCRDIIRCFTEASDICDAITEFFATEFQNGEQNEKTR